MMYDAEQPTYFAYTLAHTFAAQGWVETLATDRANALYYISREDTLQDYRRTLIKILRATNTCIDRMMKSAEGWCNCIVNTEDSIDPVDMDSVFRDNMKLLELDTKAISGFIAKWYTSVYKAAKSIPDAQTGEHTEQIPIPNDNPLFKMVRGMWQLGLRLDLAEVPPHAQIAPEVYTTHIHSILSGLSGEDHKLLQAPTDTSSTARFSIFSLFI